MKNCKIGKFYRNLDCGGTFKFNGSYPTYKDNFGDNVVCDLEEWKEPIVNEVCWFFHTNKCRPKIGRFAKKIATEITKRTIYIDDEGSHWYKCIPFTNDIPSWIQKNEIKNKEIKK
jgi:hypothetical protein